MKNVKRNILFAAAFAFLAVLIGFTGAAFASDNTELNAGEKAAILNGAAGETANAKQAVFINGVFRITSGGRYVLSGRQEGQVLIKAARNDVVELVLDNITLHSPNGPAIYAQRSRRVELILTDGTINTISDASRPKDETDAAIYIQHDLIISGNGTLNVTGNCSHGIRAQDFLTIKGGTLNVKAAGDTLRGRDGVTIEDGEFTLTAGGDGIKSNNDSNRQYGYITINGGTFTITAGDDGIQGETAVTINGGNLRITAKDDGITTKGSILITGGVVNIIDSYEGIEGLNVTITGGKIDVFARDDGINARDPTVPNTRGRFMQGRTLNENMYVRIAGGDIHVHARGDGIDSNNNIFMEGGNLRISGPSMGMEGAIDFDGVFLITGGELITAGSVINVSGQSTQPAILIGYNQQWPSGAIIEVRDARGNVLLNYTAQIAFSMSGFTSPRFRIGETYSLYINSDKAADVTLNSVVTGAGGRGGRMNQPRGPRSW